MEASKKAVEDGGFAAPAQVNGADRLASQQRPWWRDKQIVLDLRDTRKMAVFRRRLPELGASVVPLLDTGVRLFVTDRDESAAGTTGATTSLQRIQSKFARNPRAQKLYKASASSLEQGGVLLDLRKQARALNIEVWPAERLERRINYFFNTAASTSAETAGTVSAPSLPRIIVEDGYDRYHREAKAYPPASDGTCTIPKIYWESTTGCPFLRPSTSSGDSARVKEDVPKTVPREDKASRRRKKYTFCECCDVTFSVEVEQHVLSPEHQLAIGRAENTRALNAFAEQVRKAHDAEVEQYLQSIAVSVHAQQEERASVQQPELSFAVLNRRLSVMQLAPRSGSVQRLSQPQSTPAQAVSVPDAVVDDTQDDGEAVNARPAARNRPRHIALDSDDAQHAIEPAVPSAQLPEQSVTRLHMPQPVSPVKLAAPATPQKPVVEKQAAPVAQVLRTPQTARRRRAPAALALNPSAVVPQGAGEVVDAMSELPSGSGFSSFLPGMVRQQATGPVRSLIQPLPPTSPLHTPAGDVAAAQQPLSARGAAPVSAPLNSDLATPVAPSDGRKKRGRKKKAQPAAASAVSSAVPEPASTSMLPPEAVTVSLSQQSAQSLTPSTEPIAEPSERVHLALKQAALRAAQPVMIQHAVMPVFLVQGPSLSAAGHRILAAEAAQALQASYSRAEQLPTAAAAVDDAGPMQSPERKSKRQAHASPSRSKPLKAATAKAPAAAPAAAVGSRKSNKTSTLTPERQGGSSLSMLKGSNEGADMVSPVRVRPRSRSRKDPNADTVLSSLSTLPSLAPAPVGPVSAPVPATETGDVTVFASPDTIRSRRVRSVKAAQPESAAASVDSAVVAASSTAAVDATPAQPVAEPGVFVSARLRRTVKGSTAPVTTDTPATPVSTSRRRGRPPSSAQRGTRGSKPVTSDVTQPHGSSITATAATGVSAARARSPMHLSAVLPLADPDRSIVDSLFNSPDSKLRSRAALDAMLQSSPAAVAPVQRTAHAVIEPIALPVSLPPAPLGSMHVLSTQRKSIQPTTVSAQSASAAAVVPSLLTALVPQRQAARKAGTAAAAAGVRKTGKRKASAMISTEDSATASSAAAEVVQTPSMVTYHKGDVAVYVTERTNHPVVLLTDEVIDGDGDAIVTILPLYKHKPRPTNHAIKVATKLLEPICLHPDLAPPDLEAVKEYVARLNFLDDEDDQAASTALVQSNATPQLAPQPPVHAVPMMTEEPVTVTSSPAPAAGTRSRAAISTEHTATASFAAAAAAEVVQTPSMVTYHKGDVAVYVTERTNHPVVVLTDEVIDGDGDAIVTILPLCKHKPRPKNHAIRVATKLLEPICLHPDLAPPDLEAVKEHVARLNFLDEDDQAASTASVQSNATPQLAPQPPVHAVPMMTEEPVTVTSSPAPAAGTRSRAAISTEHTATASSAAAAEVVQTPSMVTYHKGDVAVYVTERTNHPVVLLTDEAIDGDGDAIVTILPLYKHKPRPSRHAIIVATKLLEPIHLHPQLAPPDLVALKKQLARRKVLKQPQPSSSTAVAHPDPAPQPPVQAAPLITQEPITVTSSPAPTADTRSHAAITVPSAAAGSITGPPAVDVLTIGSPAVQFRKRRRLGTPSSDATRSSPASAGDENKVTGLAGAGSSAPDASFGRTHSRSRVFFPPSHPDGPAKLDVVVISPDRPVSAPAAAVRQSSGDAPDSDPFAMEMSDDEDARRTQTQQSSQRPPVSEQSKGVFTSPIIVKSLLKRPISTRSPKVEPALKRVRQSSPRPAQPHLLGPPTTSPAASTNQSDRLFSPVTPRTVDGKDCSSRGATQEQLLSPADSALKKTARRQRSWEPAAALEGDSSHVDVRAKSKRARTLLPKEDAPVAKVAEQGKHSAEAVFEFE